MAISTRVRMAGAGLSAVVLLAAGTLVAQEPTPARPPAKPDAPAAKRAYDPSRRVPSYFGQIGLTPEQKEAVYKIQGGHQAKIGELEKQIDEIQARMLAECEGVLTDTQKQMLAQRRKAVADPKKVEDPEEKVKERKKSGS